ncbi:MAG: hypothetical protein MJ233_05610, partial [Mycoplasmoidaceae bacterium]|nr:hypothetical protein [Mycoplasmoidaceae bacterium]
GEHMKTKTKISLLSGLGVASAIIPALSTVSCSNAQVTNKIGEEYDKEYGVDEACYTKLKLEFETQVAAKV